MKLFKLSVTALSFIALPLLAGANESSASDWKKIVGKCTFEAPDQTQEDDCFAKFVLCPRSPASAPAARECKSILKVKCGDTIEFKGRADTSKENGSIVLEGEPNSRFPEAPTLIFDVPKSVPATVDAELDFDSTELDGSCRIKVHGDQSTPMID